MICVRLGDTELGAHSSRRCSRIGWITMGRPNMAQPMKG
uniref:Uncharacterized protein n=1 Tax=Arundo donax TaxID=35708 RepID=A0A0A9AHH7_ARUDO